MCRFSSSHWLPTYQRGAAIMIMLLILVLGSAYFLVSSLNKNGPLFPRSESTTRDLKLIHDALIGYAQNNSGCLPCPSTDTTTGVAQATCATTSGGFLPWRDLQIRAQDSWGRSYSYVVDPAFTSGCSSNPHTASADLSVLTRINGGPLVPVMITNGLAAVVVSHGANGFAASDTNGAPLPAPPASHADERENRINRIETTRNVIKHELTNDPAAAGGIFDDLVVYVTRNELNDQYTAALTP